MKTLRLRAGSDYCKDAKQAQKENNAFALEITNVEELVGRVRVTTLATLEHIGKERDEYVLNFSIPSREFLPKKGMLILLNKDLLKIKIYKENGDLFLILK